MLVPTAYGFSAKRDLLAQLLALNQQVAANIEKGSPVTAPGVPKNYPDANKLVTEDCIRPTKAVIIPLTVKETRDELIARKLALANSGTKRPTADFTGLIHPHTISHLLEIPPRTPRAD